jgi:hypothetical protein
MNAPELMPDTETWLGLAGKRPSGSAADAAPPNYAIAASSSAPAARIGRPFTPGKPAEP